MDVAFFSEYVQQVVLSAMSSSHLVSSPLQSITCLVNVFNISPFILCRTKLTLINLTVSFNGLLGMLNARDSLHEKHSGVLEMKPVESSTSDGYPPVASCYTLTAI